MQIVRLTALLVILFLVSGMSWIREKPLPKPDTPEIKIIAVGCTNGQAVR
jgi:hypothetical protein